MSFLPEEHTDFIFSVLAEEWGAVGSMHPDPAVPGAGSLGA
ncbi:MAG: FtsW/RodA/SpoVE family cell cycle protein [Desulfobacterales bacterium]|nr:FtsW/RodA/SpoVE family cell cycle protein [Desulfobacterales bacterium]